MESAGTAAAVVSGVLVMSAMALEVPLTVEEPVGAGREIEVVSGGIPMPEGVCQVKYAEMPLDDYPVDGDYWLRNGKDGKPTVTCPAGKKLWFAVRRFDDSHNRSRMSNLAELQVL